MSESTDYARKELERIGAFTEDGDFYGGVPSEVMEAFANIRRKTLPCVCGKWTPVGHHGVCVAGDLATIEAAYRRLDLALSENYARFAAMQAELTALLQKGYGDLPKLRQQRDDYGDALAKAEAELTALHVVLRAVAEATYLVRLAKDAYAWGRISFDELCIYEDDAVAILDAWKAEAELAPLRAPERNFRVAAHITKLEAELVILRAVAEVGGGNRRDSLAKTKRNRDNWKQRALAAEAELTTLRRVAGETAKWEAVARVLARILADHFETVTISDGGVVTRNDSMESALAEGADMFIKWAVQQVGDTEWKAGWK